MKKLLLIITLFTTSLITTQAQTKEATPNSYQTMLQSTNLPLICKTNAPIKVVSTIRNFSLGNSIFAKIWWGTLVTITCLGMVFNLWWITRAITNGKIPLGDGLLTWFARSLIATIILIILCGAAPAMIVSLCNQYTDPAQVASIPTDTFEIKGVYLTNSITTYELGIFIWSFPILLGIMAALSAWPKEAGFKGLLTAGAYICAGMAITILMLMVWANASVDSITQIHTEKGLEWQMIIIGILAFTAPGQAAGLINGGHALAVTIKNYLDKR